MLLGDCSDKPMAWHMQVRDMIGPIHSPLNSPRLYGPPELPESRRSASRGRHPEHSKCTTAKQNETSSFRLAKSNPQALFNRAGRVELDAADGHSVVKVDIPSKTPAPKALSLSDAEMQRDLAPEAVVLSAPDNTPPDRRGTL